MAPAEARGADWRWPGSAMRSTSPTAMNSAKAKGIQLSAWVSGLFHVSAVTATEATTAIPAATRSGPAARI